MKLKLSDDCIFFYEKGHYIIDNYVLHIQKALKKRYISLLLALTEWTDLDTLKSIAREQGIEEEECLMVLVGLSDAQLIIEFADSPSLLSSDSPFHNWNRSLKYFHFHNRILKDDPFKNTVNEYHELSNSPEKMPNIYKNYNDKEKIPLLSPSDDILFDKSFLDVLLDRQTIRSYRDEPITLRQLSDILYYVFGAVTCSLDRGIGRAIFKTSPSGGGRSSIEAYPVIFNVEGISNGLYHYSVQNHELTLLKLGDFRDEVRKMGGDQYHVGSSSVTIIYTSVLERIAWKYKTSRGYKAAFTDVGHLSQTVYLLSNWMGLGAFYIGAIRDESVENFLDINFDKEMILGMSGIGIPSANSVESNRFIREDVEYWKKRSEINA